ncbi:uncharacterized protein [Amphiura filiformis]|uniref:uncharacterized protein isoform X2 n=1 Tax=Amphiura filiformis TaxID=82378 RepID=UPI003B2234D3
MAVCTRQCCRSLLNVVRSGRAEQSGRVSANFQSPILNRALPSCTFLTQSCVDKGTTSRLKCDRTLSSPRHVSNNTLPSILARHYSEASEANEDFSRGYGGPIRQPVIDWRDRHNIDYKDFAKMVDSRNIQLIDVREPFELESAGSIENSINIPYIHFRTGMLMNPEEFKEKYKKPKPSKEDDNIVIVDLRGNRSEGALRISHELGYTKVQIFRGGFREWAEKNDLPVPPTYYEHGVPRDHWTNLKYDDLRMMIKKDNVYVIDVREPWEVVEEGSITNALNIPMGYLGFALKMDAESFEKQYGRRKPGPMDEIGFISWQGLRSAGCQLLAQELGYIKSRHFRGGMEKYNLKKKKAERPWAMDFPLPQ